MRSDSDLPAFTTTATTTTKTKKKTFIKSASMFGRVEKGDLKKEKSEKPVSRTKSNEPRISENASSFLSSSGNEPALVGDEQRFNQLGSRERQPALRFLVSSTCSPNGRCSSGSSGFSRVLCFAGRET